MNQVVQQRSFSDGDCPFNQLCFLTIIFDIGSFAGLLGTQTHSSQLYKLLHLSFFLQNTPIIQADSRDPVTKMIERLSVCILMLMTCGTVRCEKFKMLEGVMMTSSDY